MFKGKIILTLSFVLLITNNNIVAQTINSAGVTINGVTWATHNVGESGKFTENPEDNGGYFTWVEAQLACPQGWRLPTAEEFRSLIHPSHYRNIVEGRNYTEFLQVYQLTSSSHLKRIFEGEKNGKVFIFGNNKTNYIFMPAAGYRNNYHNGILSDAGETGYYWSCTEAENNYYTYQFSFIRGSHSVAFGDRTNGVSVRCVASKLEF